MSTSIIADADLMEIRTDRSGAKVLLSFKKSDMLLCTYAGPIYDFSLLKDSLRIFSKDETRRWDGWETIDGPTDPESELLAIVRLETNGYLYLKTLKFPRIEGEITTYETQMGELVSALWSSD